jgi:Na+/H+-dicarboxylate symporter
LKKVSLPIQLIAVIAGVFLCGDYFNESFVRFFYTFSLFFKEILTLTLPFIIFSFVLTGILSFKRNAPLILTILIGSIFVSNCIVALLTYAVGSFVVPSIVRGLSVENLTVEAAIQPYMHVKLPSMISSEYALIAAILTGFLLSFVHIPSIEYGVQKIKSFLQIFLNNYFIPLLPLYVFGFLLEIKYKGVFGSLFTNYGKAFILICMTQLCFLAIYYFLAASGSLQKTIAYIKSAMPSYLTAFSTMSSTATIPVSIECAEKNGVHHSLAQLSTPIMANIHLVGDSISTPLLAMVTVTLFLGQFPDPITYMKFVLLFCSAMLAVSGIPGGGIIVMIPILVTQFCFTPEMVSIITTLYLLMDSFGTAANVMGDGSLVILIDRLLKRLRLL